MEIYLQKNQMYQMNIYTYLVLNMGLKQYQKYVQVL